MKNYAKNHCIQVYRSLPQYELEVNDQQLLEKLVKEKLVESFKDWALKKIDRKYFNKRTENIYPDTIHIYGMRGYLLSEEEMTMLIENVRIESIDHFLKRINE